MAAAAVAAFGATVPRGNLRRTLGSATAGVVVAGWMATTLMMRKRNARGQLFYAPHPAPRLSLFPFVVHPICVLFFLGFIFLVVPCCRCRSI